MAGAATITAISVTSVAGAILSWLCMEGSVRSIIDVIEDPRWIVRLRYLGDVGGWTSLTIFTVIAVKSVFERLMAEGQYIQAQELTRSWYSDNRQEICQTGLKRDQMYAEVCELLTTLQTRCLFSKSIVSRHLLALDICAEPGQIETGPQLIVDRKLTDVYRQVQVELELELSTKKYVKNCCFGLASVKKRGCSAVTVSRIFGIVFPVWLITNAALSITGEVGLGKELFVDREELTDIGHFGEWPINAVEAVGTAYLLNMWYAASAGVVEATKSIFRKYLGLLADDEPAMQARLACIAKEELSQASSSCSYLQLPTDNEVNYD